MSLDIVLKEIEIIMNSIMNTHPAVVRVVISDYQGMVIAKKYKAFNFNPKEEKAPNPIVPLLNSIMENAEKFLKFLKNTPTDVFIFSWLFEKQYIFASSSPYGFLGVYCEPDVDIGWLKRILKEKTLQYNLLMRPLFM